MGAIAGDHALIDVAGMHVQETVAEHPSPVKETGDVLKEAIERDGESQGESSWRRA